MRTGKLLKTAAVAAVAVLIPTLVAFAAAPQWSSRLVDQLRARGLIVSTAPPETALTRAEAARLLVGALGLSHDARDLRLQPSRFYDVPVGEAASYIETAAELGLMRGYGDGTFGPDAPLTRAQLVAVLVRALGLEGQARDAARAPLSYADASSIPAWAWGYVAVAADKGLVKGFDDGTFRPDAATARGDAAALVVRFMEGRGSLIQRQGTLEDVASKGRIRLGGEWLALAPNAIFYRNGLAVSVDSLRKGEQVRVILDDDGRVTYLEAEISSISGVLRGVNGQSRQIRVATDDGREVDLAVPAQARVFRSGRPAALADLNPGDKVYGLLDAGRAVQALDATRIDFEGVLVDARSGGRPRLVAVGATGFLQAVLDPEAPVFLNGRRVKLEDLRPSDRLGLTRDENGTIVYVEAQR